MTDKTFLFILIGVSCFFILSASEVAFATAIPCSGDCVESSACMNGMTIDPNVRCDEVGDVCCVGKNVCGNNIIDSGELCDTHTIPNNYQCSSQGCTGGKPCCSSDCKSVIYDASGCCTGCSSGNGDMRGCTDCPVSGCSCSLDVYECTVTKEGVVKQGKCVDDDFPLKRICCYTARVCGDGVKDGSETCDTYDFGGRTCSSYFGCTGGSLTCLNNCTTISPISCTGCPTTPVCGNHILEPPDEECDSGLHGKTCLTFGFDYGQLKCGTLEYPPACKYITDGFCFNYVCGNGVLETGEQCDDGNTNSGDGCSSTCQIEGVNGSRNGWLFDSDDINPLDAESLDEIIDNLINFIFVIAIVIAPLMMLIGGVLFVTSAGNADQINKAKKIIIWTIIGFSIILFAKGIISLIG